MEKDESILIRITNKGAIVGIQMYSAILIALLNVKRITNAKTIEDVRDDFLKQLEKQTSWLDRADDKTASREEIKKAKKDSEETIKMVKKLWNISAM